MSDPTTWIDVADNAVKIGLGALVGGLIGVWTARINDRIQTRKALNERRRKVIETVLASVDGVCNTASMYWASLANAVDLRDKRTPLSQSQSAALERMEAEFWEGFAKLNSAAAKLLLLKEIAAESALIELRSSLDTLFRKAHIANSECTQEMLMQHRQSISAQRRGFYAALATSYERSA